MILVSEKVVSWHIADLMLSTARRLAIAQIGKTTGVSSGFSSLEPIVRCLGELLFIETVLVWCLRKPVLWGPPVIKMSCSELSSMDPRALNGEGIRADCGLSPGRFFFVGQWFEDIQRSVLFSHQLF